MTTPIEEINKVFETDYPSWDAVPYHDLLAMACALGMILLEQRIGQPVKVFMCNPNKFLEKEGDR